ncbi:hypothetical protein OSB04_003800 [Centaurea solstitialis]|uniref:Transposon Ty3-I Gag-Pol polyprotein n=1 Tax=Centaurea solstitialis TaxID=347529 RepID=A0AA38TXC7_9ASTR|nr:hypothetical protein OSB04_003800 [Centaurea solstitialis]
MPNSLPPHRSQDHHIPTLPSAPPINIKPYRYPYYQKQIMTAFIADMLKEGIIKASTSPYSSPVLLVQKKDDTWRFCVDYRGLNAITVKDRYPIPTVDELLDKLHSVGFLCDLGPNWFESRFGKTNLNLPESLEIDPPVMNPTNGPSSRYNSEFPTPERKTKLPPVNDKEQISSFGHGHALHRFFQSVNGNISFIEEVQIPSCISAFVTTTSAESSYAPYDHPVTA